MLLAYRVSRLQCGFHTNCVCLFVCLFVALSLCSKAPVVDCSLIANLLTARDNARAAKHSNFLISQSVGGDGEGGGGDGGLYGGGGGDAGE